MSSFALFFEVEEEIKEERSIFDKLRQDGLFYDYFQLDKSLYLLVAGLNYENEILKEETLDFLWKNESIKIIQRIQGKTRAYTKIRGMFKYVKELLDAARSVKFFVSSYQGDFWTDLPRILRHKNNPSVEKYVFKNFQLKKTVKSKKNSRLKKNSKPNEGERMMMESMESMVEKLENLSKEVVSLKEDIVSLEDTIVFLENTIQKDLKNTIQKDLKKSKDLRESNRKQIKHIDLDKRNIHANIDTLKNIINAFGHKVREDTEAIEINLKNDIKDVEQNLKETIKDSMDTNRTMLEEKIDDTSNWFDTKVKEILENQRESNIQTESPRKTKTTVSIDDGEPFDAEFYQYQFYRKDTPKEGESLTTKKKDLGPNDKNDIDNPTMDSDLDSPEKPNQK